MKRVLIALAICAAFFPARAQVVNIITPNAGGGSSTITAGTTPTSGFTAGELLYSDGSLVQASAATSDPSGNLKAKSILLNGASLPTNGIWAGNYSPGANTATAGLLLENPNAASVGNQQFACNQLTGFGWKTTATAASQEVDWQICNEPVQGTTNPTGNFVLASNINGAGLITALSIDSWGNTTFNLTHNGTFPVILSYNGGNVASVLANSVQVLGLDSGSSGAIHFANLAQVGFSGTNGAVNNAIDTIITRKAAANLQHGAADVAAPIAQTISFQSVVAGTSNTAGALTKYVDSAGTGTGASGGFEFDVHPAGSTGSTQNAASAAFTLSGAGVPALPLLTTDATLTDATVCATTVGQVLHFGSGTLGVCLGTSSARYKHDIEPIHVGLAQIMALQPKSYHLNADHGDPAKLYYGFTAEQGGRVLPALMTRDDSGEPNTFDYLGLVPVLVAAIQQQQHEIEKLEHRK